MSAPATTHASARPFVDVLPPIALTALMWLEPRGYRLVHDQLATGLGVIRPDGSLVDLDGLLGPDSEDWDDELAVILEHSLLGGGRTKTQRGRYRVGEAKTSASLPQAVRRLYREQREAIEGRLLASDDPDLLRLAGHLGGYALVILRNPLTPVDAVARVGDAYRRLDDNERLSRSAHDVLEHGIENLLCAHPNLDERQIRQLYRVPWGGVNHRLADNPNLPGDLQHLYLKEALSRHGTRTRLLAALAANTNLLPELATTIWAMSSQPRGQDLEEQRPRVLPILAANPATPAEVLIQMTEADEPELDRALYANPRLVEIESTAADRVRLEGRDDVVAVFGEQVLYGRLDRVALHSWGDSVLVVQEADGRWRAEERDWRAEELGAVEVKLPPELSRKEQKERLIPQYGYRQGADARELRKRVRLLLRADWPVPYERALAARRGRAEQTADEARASYDFQLQQQHRDLVGRMATAVQDGLGLDQAAQIGDVTRQEIEGELANRRHALEL